VFGGAGYVGRHLCLELARRGLRPVPADISAAGGGEDAPADVTSLSDVCAALAAYRPATVVNLAYLLGAEAEADAYAATQVNVMGLLNVLEGCRQFEVERCVYASSIAVYGDQASWGDRELVEADHGRPAILYGWHKQINEATAARYQRNHGLRCIGLRISSVYGPGRVTGMTAAITQMIEMAACGEDVRCPYAPDYESSLVHIDDVSVALAELVTAPNPAHAIYNTGGDCATVEQVADLIRELHPQVTVRYEPDGVHRPHVSRVSGALLQSEFGLQMPGLRQRIREWM
jgi:nucleoside-diphosphate-sugar epimerase